MRRLLWTDVERSLCTDEKTIWTDVERNLCTDEETMDRCGEKFMY